jgi:hypothetical protein
MCFASKVPQGLVVLHCIRPGRGTRTKPSPCCCSAYARLCRGPPQPSRPPGLVEIALAGAKPRTIAPRPQTLRLADLVRRPRFLLPFTQPLGGAAWFLACLSPTSAASLFAAALVNWERAALGGALCVCMSLCLGGYI